MEKIIEIINATFEYDQKLRRNNAIPVELLNDFTQIISKLVRNIISKHGFPNVSELGEQTAHNFLILIDHMSNKEYFVEIFDEYTLVSKGYDKPVIALLVDKKLNIQGKKQKFGTILEAYTDTDGSIKSRPLPIENENNIDTLRASYGLQPLAQYIGKSNEMFKKIHR